MSACRGIQAGMSLSATCPDCGHSVQAHAWPSRICSVCDLRAELTEALRVELRRIRRRARR